MISWANDTSQHQQLPACVTSLLTPDHLTVVSWLTHPDCVHSSVDCQTRNIDPGQWIQQLKSDLQPVRRRESRKYAKLEKILYQHSFLIVHSKCHMPWREQRKKQWTADKTVEFWRIFLESRNPPWLFLQCFKLCVKLGWSFSSSSIFTSFQNLLSYYWNKM